MDTDLRPLSLGEVLDRTFQLYRSHFLMFAGISSFAAGLDLVWKLIQTGVVRLVSQHITTQALGILNVGVSVINLVVYIVASAVAMAAINRAVSAIYLGQQTGIAESYREVKPHWFRYVWLYVVASLLAWGLPALAFVGVLSAAVYSRGAGQAATGLMLAGILGLSMLALAPLGVWITLRYSLANAACVFEDLGIRASLKRSVYLAKGEKRKIFVMLFLAWLIRLIMTYAGLTPVIVVAAKSFANHTPAAISLGMTIYTLLIGFVTSSVTIPVFAIGLTLFYYDARIRKEGFDVEWMMQRANPATPASLVTPMEVGLVEVALAEVAPTEVAPTESSLG